MNINKVLVDNARKNIDLFRKIVKNSLNLKKEKLLVICDSQETALEFGLSFHYSVDKSCLIIQSPRLSHMQASFEVKKSLIDLPLGSVIILCLSGKLGKLGEIKSFRKFCENKGHRFISLMNLGLINATTKSQYLESCQVSSRRLLKNSKNILKKINKSKLIRITGPGTDLTLNVDGKIPKLNTGDFYKPKQGGNVPSGEIMLPVKGYHGVNGKINFNGFLRCIEGDKSLQGNIHVNEGRIFFHDIPELEKLFNEFESRSKYPWRIRHVSSINFGLNPCVSILGNLTVDSKSLGNITLTIGSNYWFGGDIKTIMHTTLTLNDVNVFADGVKVL